MRVAISEKAEKDLDDMEPALRKFFFKHIEKISQMPPRRHMRFGLPYNVEDVTKAARLVYYTENETLFILRCFSRHKEYEKWYMLFR